MVNLIFHLGATLVLVAALWLGLKERQKAQAWQESVVPFLMLDMWSSAQRGGFVRAVRSVEAHLFEKGHTVTVAVSLLPKEGGVSREALTSFFYAVGASRQEGIPFVDPSGRALGREEVLQAWQGKRCQWALVHTGGEWCWQMVQRAAA